MNKVTPPPEKYSKPVMIAYAVLAASYLAMVILLWILKKNGLVDFPVLKAGDVFPLLTSLPFVALYLVVLLAATAGYARGAIMAKQLPFNTMLRNELQNRTMKRSTIRTKIRGGSTITEETSFMRVLQTVSSSRISILGVVDPKGAVTGVLTDRDLLRTLQEEIDKTEHNKSGEKTLLHRLNELKVKDLAPRQPVVATVADTLEKVLDTMIQHQYTKLIVVDDGKGNAFRGTVDALDLVGEIMEGGEPEA